MVPEVQMGKLSPFSSLLSGYATLKASSLVPQFTDQWDVEL